MCRTKWPSFRRSSSTAFPVPNPTVPKTYFQLQPRVRAARLGFGVAWALLCMVGRLSAAEDPFWRDHVEPLFRDRCGNCHSGVKTKSGLDLGDFASILRGGDRGSAIVPGRPDDSLLLKVLAPGGDPHMPPKGQLTDEQIGLVRTWIQRQKASDGTPVSNGVPAVAASAPPRKPPVWTPPSDLSPTRVVDRFLELGWKERKVRPSDAADDAAFLRRLHLDLVGRIPTETELAEALADRKPGRHGRWVDRLLASPEHPRHLAEVFDVVLMARRRGDFEDQRRQNGWFDYLEASFRENRPWNGVLHELIVARPRNPEERGAAWFLYERKGNAQAMAEAVAPLVFGVQIQCAQCHDHMIAREIKQAHYWGLVAAFNRTRNVDTPKGPGLAESAIGGFVSFANLKKESQPALMTLFNGRRIDEAWPKEGEKEVDEPARYKVPPTTDKGPVPAPAEPLFSRRAALAEAVTTDNPLLARAMVNRVWAMLFGRGLVHPVELMDSKHPASHPDLLDWLAADFQAHGHDVRRLIRTLALTRAYAMDSRPRGSKAPPADAFACGPEKPLSAEALYRSIVLLTASGDAVKATDRDLRRAFVRQFPDLFPTEYNATLQQALFLSNAPGFDALLEPRDGGLTRRLAGIPDPSKRAAEAIRIVLGRPAAKDEVREAAGFLASRSVEAGTKQLLWALLTSPEFQTNH